MPRHQYSSLDEADDEIRLVTIRRGAGSAAIVLDLHHTYLRENELAPSYEALSYTWGSAQDRVNVQIGDNKDDILSVTKNLDVALHHLRLPDRPRVFWIDAICVDQDNLQERGHQVRRMADIYTRADRVVVWLGSGSLHTGSAMKALEMLSHNVQADWSLWITKPAAGISGSEHHWADPEIALPYHEETIDGIQDLYGRDWFQRLWVQQEIRLANNNAIVVCGHESITFTDLRQAALCLFNKTVLDSKIPKARLSHIWSMGDLGYTNLPGIISFTRPCQCSDPRDRIFAVLSFLQKYEKSLTITPDYRQTWQEVYQETTWRWIEHNSALDILTLCDGTSVAAGLPSWVPNFASPPKSYLLQTISTASARTSSNAISSGGALTLEGVHLATVQGLRAWQENEPIEDTIRRLAPPDVTAAPQTSECESALGIFCSTLNGNLFSRSYLPDDTNSPNFERFQDIVGQILAPQFDVSHLSETDRAELYNAEKYLRGRAFFMTDTGTMGLAPSTAHVGDRIVILLGARSAFLLRPSNALKGHFELVGESYIHGYMYGEALLGPFPEHVRSIARYDERTEAYWRCYLNTLSGECEIEDPRLGPLPSGWRRNAHDKDHVISWFVNDSTGEGFDQEMRDNGYTDPRLEPGALRARIANLQLFNLI